MSAQTSIEWCDRTWNPVRGCSVVSAGCKNCYAMKVAARFSGPGMAYEGLALRSPARWTGTVRLVEGARLEPLSWRKPCRVFVNSMSDLFHEDLPEAVIDQVFAVMALSPWHTFQVLTKRPQGMCSYLTGDGVAARIRMCGLLTMKRRWSVGNAVATDSSEGVHRVNRMEWPLSNVWLGVSVEDQRSADERIPILLDTPASVRFLSVEPLLGPVDLGYRGAGALLVDGGGDRMQPQALAPNQVDWVIVGGESGPGARPCDVAWVRSVVQQCRVARVPCFVKQLGAHPRWSEHPNDFLNGFTEGHELEHPKGGDWHEWPADLRVREFPVDAAAGGPPRRN